MLFNLPYRNTHEAAKRLRTEGFPDLHLLMFNRFDEENSRYWWLSPKRVQSGFPLPKFIVTTDHWVDDDELFCGFHVEKGFGINVGWPENQIIDDTWYWDSFLALADTSLEPKIEAARRPIGSPLAIYVGAGVYNERGDHLLFTVDQQNLHCDQFEKVDGILSDAAVCTRLDELIVELKVLNGEKGQWHWVDVMIGHAFQANSDGPDDTVACISMLRPFEDWIMSRS